MSLVIQPAVVFPSKSKSQPAAFSSGVKALSAANAVHEPSRRITVQRCILADQPLCGGIPNHSFALAERFDRKLDRHHRRSAKVRIARELVFPAKHIDEIAFQIPALLNGDSTL